MNSTKLSLAAALAAALFLSFGWTWSGERPGTLRQLRKPVEEAPKPEDDEPVTPAPVGPASQVIDPARICPDGAVWYAAVPDAARFNSDLAQSSIGSFANESTVALTFKNNRFGLPYLFGDLPKAVIAQDRVAAMSSIVDLADVMSRSALRMGAACYIDEEGVFSFLFIFDVGLDRLEAFNVMAEWETSFYLANPGSEVTRGNHAGNFIDVWRLKAGDQGNQRGEIAAGFVENMFVISNNPGLAESSLALLGGGANLSQSNWGQRLAASIPSSTTADAVCFLRMDALLGGLARTPIARNSVAAWADFLGRGGNNGEAIYYGMQFTEDGTRETFLLPSAGEAGSASLVEVLAKRLKRADSWTSTTVIPYLPNPAFFLGVMMEGRQLGSLLRQERRLFGSTDTPSVFEIPPPMRAVITNEVMSLFTGEMGIAIYPGEQGEEPPWLMVLPCVSNPTALMKKTESMTERNAATIYSNEPDWRNRPSWTIVSSSAFRRLEGHYLLFASKGDTIVSVLDQLLSGTSFSTNKDFARSLSLAEKNQGMIFYLNIPEIVVRQYPNLPAIMRRLYPRSSGLNSRPPLSLLRRYAKGLMGVISPSNGNGNGNGDFTRVTVQSPLPSLGILAAGTVLQFPASLREDGRVAMAQSRENLKNLWLKLQMYSSRYGHFPENISDLVADMRLSMTEDEIRTLLTAPGALGRMDRAEAVNNSYRYLSGVTPSDEPDIPILYEAEPWGEDFSGMYPNALSGRSPSERGEFQPYRQMVLLDGRGVVIPERRFQDRVVPRLTERE